MAYLPSFVIVSLLLNFTLYGLVFNLNFDKISEAKLSLGKIAQASTTAVTAVTVKNAPPLWGGTLWPTEFPTSTTTTPYNVGTSTSFQLPTDAVTDAESNGVKLLVCAGNSTPVIVGTSTATNLSCTGPATTTLCLSATWASTTIANSSSTSCSIPNVADYGSETQSWTAYVCDNHANQPDCSTGSTGSAAAADGASPFYINHRTVVTGATTTVNNVNPGQSITIRATTSDPDVARGGDGVKITVCSVAGWTATGGCTVPANTICTSTVAVTTTPACSATTSVPLMHSSYTYFVYAEDQFLFGSSTPQSSTYTINDVAPTFSTISLNNGNDIFLNLKNAGDKVVYASSTVTDNNGCTDLNAATASSTVYLTSLGSSCVASSSNCYQATTTATCTITGCAGNNAMVTCSSSLKYFAVSSQATGTNPIGTDSWTAALRIFDNSLTTLATSTPIDVMASLGLDVAEPQIAYGTLQGGGNSGTTNGTTTVINFGNSPLSMYIFGTDMNRAGGGTIPVANQKFSTSSADNYGAKPKTLNAATSSNPMYTDVPRPRGIDTWVSVYWGISIPGGLPSGDYNGVNTFMAFLNPSGPASAW